MKIKYNDPSTTPRFDIIATDGRHIIKQFIDHKTGYIVVMEINTEQLSDTNVYYTLIEPSKGLIISPQERLASIETERIILNKEYGLRLTIIHTINMQTGQETLHETLVEILTGKVKSTRQSSPFAPEPSPNLLDIYLERQAEKQVNSTQLYEKYAQMSLEEKKAYWLRNVMLQMRFQDESGLDEYAFFTPENYAEWLATEPDFDQILDFVIENIPDDTENVRAKINERLGRS
ncbi:MAG TPA: hypothetical protein VK203_31075 [Nostocaceae cyanobacterium]|nr:hypothetical protein [Nostocaceae cyanobacterium]